MQAPAADAAEERPTEAVEEQPFDPLDAPTSDEDDEAGAARMKTFAEIRRMLFVGTSLHYVCMSGLLRFACLVWLACLVLLALSARWCCLPVMPACLGFAWFDSFASVRLVGAACSACHFSSSWLVRSLKFAEEEFPPGQPVARAAGRGPHQARWEGITGRHHALGQAHAYGGTAQSCDNKVHV